jgi:pimeloyl-ACP methyl ester carboxylesterase
MSVGTSFATRVVGAAAVALFTVPGWTGAADAAPGGSSTTSTGERALPTPVQVRSEPEGITLADPAFEPLPGARADFGRLGGAVYQIEIPANWNRQLVLHMHGFEELGPEASATAPDFRGYLIAHGYAWGASSFSSTSSIPGRSADETAALWDHFVATHGRPTRTYVTGLSMGGGATHIAAERYPDRFDGGLGFCGSAGQTPGAQNLANFFVAAAYAARVTQAEFDATADLGALIRDRIRPALQDPQVRKTFEDVMLDLTGGPRAFAREGFRLEEETNWTRAELLVAAKLAPNRDTRYRLGPLSRVTSVEFNRSVIRLPTNDATGDQLARNFFEGEDTTGDLQIPVVTIHSTGDGQVPIEQARIYRRRVEDAGRGDLLVQRVIGDVGHCGFRTTEMEAGFEALVDWVEHGKKPKGTDVLVDDLRKLGRTFELSPRPGTPEANTVRGARDRAVLRGSATLDGQPFDARFLGAIVRRNGLMTPCQYTLTAVRNGRYEIGVLADAEASGCGAKGAEIILWTFVQGERFHSAAVPWPGDGRTASVDAGFSTAAPDGAAAPTTSAFVGEVYDKRGRHLPPGTLVEAYVGATRCGVASVRRTGSFSGYTLTVVGPDSVPGCEPGAALNFRLDGRPAANTAVNERGGESSLDLTLQ